MLWHKRRRVLGGRIWSHLRAGFFFLMTNYIYSSGTAVLPFKTRKILLCLLLYSLHQDYMLVIKY